MTDQQQIDHDNLIRFETKLDAILSQVQKTNGRVTKSEDDINNLSNWRFYLSGGMALFCLVILPLVWILLQDVRSDGDLIKSHIAQTK